MRSFSAMIAIFLLGALSANAQERDLQGVYAMHRSGCGVSHKQIRIRNGVIQGADFRCDLYPCRGRKCPKPAITRRGRLVEEHPAGTGMSQFGATCSYSRGRSASGLLVLDMGSYYDHFALLRPGKDWIDFYPCPPRRVVNPDGIRD
jgi:hypothetical protein